MSLTVIGESLVDIIVARDGSRDERPGGSCLNVAVAAARLGIDAALLTQLADDERGELVRRHAADSHVSLHAAPTASGRTSSATATVGESGAASYDFDLDWSLPAQMPSAAAGATVIHVGSLGTVLAPGADAVADLLAAAPEGTVVSYDPNVRPSFAADRDSALAGVRSWADRADLVKLSDEDCEHLAPGTAPGELAASLVGGRTRLVVLTRGGDGATAYAHDLEVSVPAPRSQVADTVGAGDTFSAALIAALLIEDRLADDAWHRDERVVRRVLIAAAAAAAVTVTRPGADPPRLAELGAWPGG